MSLLDQVKEEVSASLEKLFEKDPSLKTVFDNVAEPEQVHRWKAVWYDDKGNIQVNTCWRVQQNSCLGPYKGGLRFDESVTLDVLRFLALEQTFKNALTGKAIGGGKGGSNFSPRNKSQGEINRFCQAFMTGLHKFVGPDVDVPAGDIGVDGRVIGYLYGSWKRLGGGHNGVLTGKSVTLSGSNLRAEATGYGIIYLLQEHLAKTRKTKKQLLKKFKVIISGVGNVATHCAKKAIQQQAQVLTVSDRKGTYFCANGLQEKDIDAILNHKRKNGKLPKHIEQIKKKPWEVISDKKLSIDIVIPCATQNEINENDAKLIIQSKCKVLIEGSNLSSTAAAVHVYKSHSKTLDYIGSKLANLGGVGTSYLEMMQNAQKQRWTSERVDEELHNIMKHAYQLASSAAAEYNVSLSDGANIAAFKKVANAMRLLGYAQ